MMHQDDTQNGLRICFDRILPLDLHVQAAQRAIEENHRNHPRHILGDALLSRSIANSSLKMALFTGKKWAPGRTLRCDFLDGSGTQKERVVQIAQEWSRYANIAFDFSGDSSSEIRISFQADPGSWSALGTDCLESDYFKAGDPTMNFGWLTDETDFDEYRRVVLHEFGHALGAVHEAANPVDNPLRWDKEAVYRAFMGPPNNWTKDEIDENVFARYEASELNASSFDLQSIMLYAFPPELMENRRGTPMNRVLSPMDKSFIAEWYPYARDQKSSTRVTEGGAVRSGLPAPARLHQPSAQPASLAGKVLPDITVFDDIDFGGDSWRTSFAYSYVGDDWNDKVSSFIIHAGTFQFFEHKDFGATTWSPVMLGPGYYRWVGDVGIANDSISSWHAFYG